MTYLSKLETALMLNVSERRLDEMLEANEFPAATHLRGGRPFWGLQRIRRELARLRPFPARGVNRASRLPASCEVR